MKKSSKFCTVAPPLPPVKSFHLVHCPQNAKFWRLLHFRNFRTADAANDVATEFYERWLWRNVYPLHRLTISKKVQSLVAAFSKLDRWLKIKTWQFFFGKRSRILMRCWRVVWCFLRQHCTAKTLGEFRSGETRKSLAVAKHEKELPKWGATLSREPKVQSRCHLAPRRKLRPPNSNMKH